MFNEEKLGPIFQEKMFGRLRRREQHQKPRCSSFLVPLLDGFVSGNIYFQLYNSPMAIPWFSMFFWNFDVSLFEHQAPSPFEETTAKQKVLGAPGC